MRISNYSVGNQPTVNEESTGEKLGTPLGRESANPGNSHAISWGAATATPQNPLANARQTASDPGAQTFESIFGALKALVSGPFGQSGQRQVGNSTGNTAQNPLAGISQPPSALGVPTRSANDAIGNSISPETAGNSGQMPLEEVVTTLGRHEDLLKKPLNREGLEKLRDDPKTPSDAKAALDALLNDPGMLSKFDQAKNGKLDGKISSKDVRELQKLPEVKQYADAKAETYTHNYVPSDSKPDSPAREMTSNDAMRELFRYSESLPGKNIDLKTLQNIADGSQDMGKCPPQLAAAAKFFTDNPGQWQQLTQDNHGKVSRDRLCDLAAQNVTLSPAEDKAITTLENNKDIFFKHGSLKPDKLKDIANDTKNSQEVRDAANLLAQPNSMLFSMLDNGKHGAGGNFFNKANDKKIGEGDLSAFLNKSHTRGQVSGAPQLSKTSGEYDPAAETDMDAGQETQPDAKKEKGGGIFKLLDALSYLSILIPGVGELNAARVVATTVGKAVVEAGVKEAGKQGAKEAVKEVAKQEAKQGAKDLGKEYAKETAKRGGKEAVKEMGKDYVSDLTQEQMNRIKGGDDGIDAPTVWAQS